MMSRSCTGRPAASRAKARNAMESHDSAGDSSSGYDSSASCKTTGRRTRRGGYGARNAVASAFRVVLVWSGVDEMRANPGDRTGQPASGSSPVSDGDAVPDPEFFGGHPRSLDTVGDLLERDLASVVGRPVVWFLVDRERREPAIIGRAKALPRNEIG